MKNISKKHQEKMVEWYGKYILRHLQAIEDAGMSLTAARQTK